MPLTTTGSPNIAILNSKIVADLCAGIFYVDLSPSVYIGSGASNVLGANVQIQNPAGVIVKPYGTNYEIAPNLSGGMDAAVSFAVPTIGGGYQLGNYTVTVKLFDANGTTYTLEKTVSICAPDANNKSRKYALLSAKMLGNCTDGKMAVIVDGVPNYNGKIVESQVNALVLDYPTGSGLDQEDANITNFSVVLFEGVYKLVGTICATYNMGDYVFVKVNYHVKKEHNQKCIIDFCCVASKLSELRSKQDSDCSIKEKENTANTILETLFLLKSADLAATCGEDPSDIISQLEELLGCSCTCNCNEGTPIINNAPVADVVIEGCNVSKTTVGLTSTYTINNYAYVVSIVNNGGALTVSDATLNGCTKTQVLQFNLGVVYNQIVAAASVHAQTFVWGEIVSDALNGVDVSCLGLTAEQWAVMTWTERVQAIINSKCLGGSCNADIKGGIVKANQVGNTIVFQWTEENSPVNMDVYIDNVLVATVLGGIETYTYEMPVNGQRVLSYKIIPKCANGAYGQAVAGSITLYGAVQIAPPVVYTPFLQNICPYDLTTNLSPLPLGLTYEFHTANNTSPTSLVADPTHAIAGTYFVFAKDNNGFYSTGTSIQLVCDVSGSCSAPQNLQVVPQVGGNQLRFQSAAYPPPLNSYTVKRRLKSDSDISGNYTTIGTPTFNASLSRWVIVDTTAANNVLYTYRAFSNCGSTAPYIDFDYAGITCPSVSFVGHPRGIDYSFVPIGGEVDKYEVVVYSDSGITQVHKDTYTPAFSNPTTGAFTSLTPDTTYYVGIKVYIGSYVKVCSIASLKTLRGEAVITVDYIAGKWLLSLDTPLGVNVQLKQANATGYTTNCSTASGETDTVGSFVTIPAGSLAASSSTNGLSYLSTRYKLANAANFAVVGDVVDGDTATLGGATVTFKINHIVCGFYPA